MDSVLKWLLDGDVSIQYMTHRNLLHSDAALLRGLQERITQEGYGARFLSCRSETGHWGLHYYQPKWTSTHYTLLDLKNLCAPETLNPCREMVVRMFDECQLENGGMNLSKHEHPSDICVDGMALNYASYFCGEEPRLGRLAAHLLLAQKADGGFTWDLNSDNGDPHTTICVLEGFAQYRASRKAPLASLNAASDRAVGFLLRHGLFLEDADSRFRKLSYPYRYRFDVLRALEYFAAQTVPFNARMRPALDWLGGKRKPDGRWYLENQHKGNVHFAMEPVGKPSRFITLKALAIRDSFERSNVSL